MINLNFKETIADLAKEQALDFVQDKVTDFLVDDEEEYTVIDELPQFDSTPYEPVSNPPSQEVLQAKQAAQVLVQRVEGKNLFSLPSMITIAFFILSTCFLDIDAALIDGKLSFREGFKIVYLVMGAVATLVARGSEGKSGTYTPDWCPGLSKCDFLDENQDGIDDREQTSV